MSAVAIQEVRVRVPQIQDISTAIRLYYERVELSTKDIVTIFGCGKNAAVNLKKLAKQKMAEQQTPAWNAQNVNTEVAFEAWGLDISSLEHRLSRLRRLKLTREETGSDG